ncbi:MAG: alpha/beta fold hydrolase [Pirellulaceae bacterium]
MAGIIDQATECDRPPVALFSHCFTCNKDLKAIVRISRFLAEHGITVLRYDMTGLGNSGGNFAETNFTTNLADLHAAARFLQEEYSPPAALLGLSFGGAASLAAATKANVARHACWNRLSAVATLAAPSDTQHLATLMLQMNPQIGQRGNGEVTIGGRQWTITEQMIEDFRRHQLPDRITEIAVPLLICHSPSDSTVGYEEALRILQLASTQPQEDEQRPPVSLLTLDHADHLLSTDPRDLPFVAEMIAAFVHRYAGSAAGNESA